MYCCWALALLPLSSIAVRGTALAVCIFLIAGSGWSKILVGGFRDWADENTLGTIIAHYQHLSFADAGPGLPRLRRCLPQVAFDHLSCWPPSLLSLKLDCACLSFHPERVALAMVGVLAGACGHCCSASFVRDGCAQHGSLCAWFCGFREFRRGSHNLLLVMGVDCAILPVILMTLVRTLLLSTHLLAAYPAAASRGLALHTFCHGNGKQWADLFRVFIQATRGSYYLLCLRPGGEGEAEDRHRRHLVGHAVMPHCGSRCRGEGRPFDEQLRFLGTACWGPCAAKSLKSTGGCWDAKRFVMDVGRWLSAERRLLDLATGEL